MGTPNYPKSFESEWSKLKREARGAFTSGNSRKGMGKLTSILEVTGMLILKAGAILIAKYANGRDALRLGRFDIGGGTEVEGIAIHRPDGSLMFWAYGDSSLEGFWSFWDRTGNMVISDDGQSGIGLARPYLPYQSTNYGDLTSPKMLSTSTSYSAQHLISGRMQHPRIQLYGYLHCNGSDVGQVRLRDPSTGTVVATSDNSTSGWIELTGLHPGYNFINGFTYDVEVRRVSGTSSGVGFTVVNCYGIQS